MVTIKIVPSKSLETASDDIAFLEKIRTVSLDDLYTFLDEWPTSSKLRYRWKRVAVAREICRREGC